jgi:hypothetical protein
MLIIAGVVAFVLGAALLIAAVVFLRGEGLGLEHDERLEVERIANQLRRAGVSNQQDTVATTLAMRTARTEDIVQNVVMVFFMFVAGSTAVLFSLLALFWSRYLALNASFKELSQSLSKERSP